MTVLQTATELHDAGHFIDALRTLETGRLTHEDRVAGLVLRATLLFQLGRIGEARSTALDLGRMDLSPAHRSACEYVLGKVARENREHDVAVEHLTRSISLAKQAKNLAQVCRAQLSLMLLVCDGQGPDAASPLIADTRSNVIKLGNPQTSAALHVFVGEAEAKRGLLASAHRHSVLALELLRTAPNIWLESIAQNLLMAISIERADFDAGLDQGLQALDLAERSGNAAMRRTCLGNLGNLHYALGDLDRADDYFERALKALPSGTQAVSCLANLARVRIAQGRLEDAEQLLDKIDESVSNEKDQVLYAYRYANLTRAIASFRRGLVDSALSQIEAVLRACEQAADKMLKQKALLTEAELLLAASSFTKYRVPLDAALANFCGDSPQLLVQCEQILGSAAAADGQLHVARYHFERADRVRRALRLVVPEFEVTKRNCHSIASAGTAESSSDLTGPATIFDAAAILQSVASIVANIARPELVGRELLSVVGSIGCSNAAKLTARGQSGERTLAEIGSIESSPAKAQIQRLKIGEARGEMIELTLVCNGDIESATTINALARLLSAFHELDNARTEREERATLWPAEQLPVEDGRAVIGGHMRELMLLVQRVARANISVLISGESGTGKEIIARAIHDASDRAHKPFVPVNCAAIPRELMESQLFGHRRGAFTGADRDVAGFIRSANGGTLFLDEIGELSLDLQPKLLRFLESGEIAPLGDPHPLNVSVRVLAATNRNLEELVREGKFREDLYYRLNVVPLPIRPLRERRDEIPGLVQHFVEQAARQFKKGHLTVAEETMERLLLYRWPGNVRQLQHEIQRIVALAEPNSTILPDAISEDILGALPLLRPVSSSREMAVSLNEKLPPTIARIECEMIKIALKDNRGKVDAAAKALGISRKGLYLKRQRLGL
jgi:transcriptional regulator with PAS, ATPase and Fis domain